MPHNRRKYKYHAIIIMLAMTELSFIHKGFFIQSELFCIQHLPCLKSFAGSLEVVWRFEQRIFYMGLLRIRLILACQEVLE